MDRKVAIVFPVCINYLGSVSPGSYCIEIMMTHRGHSRCGPKNIKLHAEAGSCDLIVLILWTYKMEKLWGHGGLPQGSRKPPSMCGRVGFYARRALEAII